MNHLATRLLGVALMLVASIALVGCDDEITSVEDIEFQTLVNVPSNEITITGGQPENPAQFEISYQGLDARPSVSTGSESLDAEVVEETGSPDAGTTTWQITYLGSIDGASLSEAMTINIQSDGESFEENIDVQVNNPLSVTQEAFTFVNGQTPLPRIRVTYEGLEQAPELTSESSAVNIELADEVGDPVAGERAWTLEYVDFISGDFVTETVQLTASSNGATYTRALSVQFNSSILTTTDFITDFIVVEDFETEFSIPEIATEGGTSATVQTGEASPNSTGRNALEVQATGGDPVTLVRNASAPGLNTLSFLVKPDATTDLNMTVTIAEQVDGESVTHETDFIVQAGSEWVRYDIALSVRTPELNPVAERDGGNGPLESISFTVEEDITYFLDDVMMGTPDRSVLEINDFESTNMAYGGSSNLTLGFSDVVPEGSTGFTSRSFSYVGDGSGNFFGYNFNSNGTDLFLSNAANGDVVLRIGAVSQDFDLFAFIQPPEGLGYESGTTVPVEAGEEWREVRIPLSDLRDDPSALFNPGIGNVGFEIRGADGADEDNPVEFLIDEIVLDAQGE
jgi:hypothetical protein